MKPPIVVYPIPFDAFTTFERFVRRFADTFRKFGPGVQDYELYVVSNWGQPTPEIREWFWDTKARFVEYWDHGCDIGSAQHVAQYHTEDRLIVAMTSRCYFHREGWLRRFVEAREKHGSGLYGAFASWEGGKPHICTRAYAMDAGLWNSFPEQINTREKGQKFEVGEWCLTQWVRDHNLPTVQVLWDNEQFLCDWRKWAGAFRNDRQQACLVWDKHTDIYTEASLQEKERLEAMADVPRFSQHGEDQWIIQNLDLPVKGTFCEVGAYDGIVGSNTLAFERMGWTGVCCEAVSEMADQCRDNRECVVFSGVVGNQTGEVTFNMNQGDAGLSGIGRPGVPIKCHATPLSKILADAGIRNLNLLSIDTEGTELDVWESLGKVRPKVVIMEHTTCNEPSQAGAIEKRLAQDGYKVVHQTEHNLILALL